jgi:hypothetical protein
MTKIDNLARIVTKLVTIAFSFMMLIGCVTSIPASPSADEFLSNEKIYYSKTEPEYRYAFRTAINLLADEADIEDLVNEILKLPSLEAENSNIIFISTDMTLETIVVGGLNPSGAGFILSRENGEVKRFKIPDTNKLLSIDKNPCFIFADKESTNYQLGAFTHGTLLFISKITKSKVVARSAVYGVEKISLSEELGISPNDDLQFASACANYLGIYSQ